MVAKERRTKHFSENKDREAIEWNSVNTAHIYCIEGVVGMIIPNESKIYLIQLQHDDNPNIQAWKASE